MVKKGVADTVLRGKGTNVLINNLRKEFDVSYGYARRLAVTESARVYSEAQSANYEANGVEWYEVMTELKACQICQPFNRRIFKVSELVPALNAPPFHPNCRCTTVPHFLIDLKRVGRDEEFLHADMNNKNQSSKYIAKDKEKMYDQDTRETKARFYSGQLLSNISKAEPKITSDMQRIAGENQLAGLEFRKKTAESLARKITADSQVENISSAEAASKINDALRYTTIFDPDNFTEEYSKMKQKLIAEGYRVVKVKNTWITNGPYKGVNTVIEKDGINFEMQYHTQESFDLKNGPLHELYEKRRLSSTTKAERHKLDAEMVKLSKTLKVPKNIERVE
ncbi:minor capsid protein [Granulicatella sp. UMB5615A]|nr:MULTISPECIES: minor capsid protein [unclassified Granulicatella]MDK8381421.1 minor capsid protein [Granulicatella sp. UMB5615B]MDK8523244.1 minor capsid protein [Granulicatella sp. UMB5615A]